MMTLSGRWGVVCAVCAVALTGCGSGEDATADNFRSAIDRGLEDNGILCLGAQIVWPAEMPDFLLGSDAGRRWQALGAAGS